jgi:arginyl-tRNA synthetase
VTPSALAAAIIDAVARAVATGDLSVPVPTEVTVERPRVREHGDYATNAAMRLAKPAGRPPREVAEIVAGQLRDHDGIAKVEVAGPGFLNITLAEGALGGLVRTIVTAGPAYGCSDQLAGQRINLEFVSANPTGPLHIGGVRWAAVGDALARMLEASGAEVTREYYFNDAGAQIDRFAASLYAAARGEPTPEDGYAGQYIGEIANQVVAAEPTVLEQSPEQALEVFRARGIELMFAEIKQRLADFGVRFDVYTNERAFHAGGQLDSALARLEEQGHTYRADGALWLRTTDFGDDKDRVLIRGDGRPTYFAADAAYYLNKRGRGFGKVLMILGADHHGYIGRLRAIAACAGDDPDQTLEILIGQLVNLSRGGEAVRMSKRAGQVVSLEDLVDAVGVDAGRYALARTSIDSGIDIDLDLWSRRAPENPVFYVQYAHSRMASVRRNAAELGIDTGDVSTVDFSLLGTERESDLLRALGEFPRVVAAAAELRGPHRVARYAEELAGHWHRFYESCRMLPYGEEPVTDLNIARLWLAAATQQVLAGALGLLGVSAPERM